LKKHEGLELRLIHAIEWCAAADLVPAQDGMQRRVYTVCGDIDIMPILAQNRFPAILFYTNKTKHKPT
jgi:hypothetical protein